jgi:DNA-binding GntR family transcriptional regulator
VAPLRLDQAANLYAVGGVLDALAAEQATPRLSDADFAALERANHRFLETDCPEDLQDNDRAFHDIYYSAAQNPLIVAILEGLLYEVGRLERVNFRDPSTPEVAFREHAAIIDAFRARDTQAAAQAARFNWEHAWTRVDSMLANGRKEFDT